MLTAKKLIEEAESLPVEERVLVADSLLKSLNTPQDGIDQKWIKVAKRRLEEIRTSKVQPISGEQVFSKIHKRFSK